MTRLLRSLFVAARRFAPLFSRALDTPLGAVGSLLPAGVCYRALRRLPGQDLHLLEQHVFRTHHFIIVTKPGIACVVSQISNSPGTGTTKTQTGARALGVERHRLLARRRSKCVTSPAQNGNATGQALGAKDGGKPSISRRMPGAGLSGRCPGKAPSDMPAFQPYWGKPAVRNDRGERGDVGIIRSPVRASFLPDWRGSWVTVIPTPTPGSLGQDCKPSLPVQRSRRRYGIRVSGDRDSTLPETLRCQKHGTKRYQVQETKRRSGKGFSTKSHDEYFDARNEPTRA